MSSTFGSFNTVRLGIYAAQKGLDVTGNNITNINTTGYTRQRLDQVSLMSSATDRYHSTYKVRIGQGAVITSVSQIRDPSLDISFRKASADLAETDQWLAGLEDLATILDEVGKGDGVQDDGVILNQLNDLRDLINKANTNGIQGYDALIKGSADTLCRLFNSYADKLADLEDKYVTELDQQVSEVNDILNNLRDINVQIRNSDIRGDDGLELRDQRNLLLDELSKYMAIDVSYSMEPIGAGQQVEKLTVKLASAEGHNHTLVDGEYATQISHEGPAAQDGETGYAITLGQLQDKDGAPKVPWETGDPGNPNGTPPTASTTLVDNDIHGSLQAIRELLTEEGEFSSNNDVVNVDGEALTKRGIPYYQKALDSLARTFAQAMNDLNNVPDADKPLVDGDGNLFSDGSESNVTDNLTAANITISKDWREGNVSMISSRDPNAPTDDRSNLAAFLDLFSKSHTFNPKEIDQWAAGASFDGTFEEMLLHIQSTLGEDQMSTGVILNNYSITYNEIYTDRDSVSGVDLNDEATNLMVYQKAYTAACRLMTVLEQALDSLINGTVV